MESPDCRYDQCAFDIEETTKSFYKVHDIYYKHTYTVHFVKLTRVLYKQIERETLFKQLAHALMGLTSLRSVGQASGLKTEAGFLRYCFKEEVLLLKPVFALCLWIR